MAIDSIEQSRYNVKFKCSIFKILKIIFIFLYKNAFTNLNFYFFTNEVLVSVRVFENLKYRFRLVSSSKICALFRFPNWYFRSWHQSLI